MKYQIKIQTLEINNINFMKIILVPLLILFGCSSYAYAYIGPGIGLGALISVVGVILAIIFLLIALIWFPLKRYLRKKIDKKANNDKND